jgi:hypothetical protein
MNAVEIEEAVSDLVLQPFDRDEFPFQFLEAFGNKDTTLKRLRKGSSNRTDVDGAVLQRSNIHILATAPGETEAGLKALQASPKTVQQKAKFILATDGIDVQAIDLTNDMPLTCAYQDLPTHFGFLLPLAGITTVSEIKNNPIDIKATGRLDKLYVALLQDERNKDWAQEKNRERFNHFMAQLIFCFFAEDTGIFNGDNLFTATVEKMSHGDPDLTQEVITTIFSAMNLDPRKGERKDVRPYANKFPYVNGGLFGGPDDGSKVEVPVFNKMARTYLIRAGELDWTAINPDIFGSMIQAVADDEERGELGMHYTSVPNILKVLNPLFLDSLNADLEKAGYNKQQLGKLKKRIARIRVFDPACGSGNFLVIAYKRMREIEHKANQAAGWETDKSVIPLTNFRGIELKSFAAEIARLALIIAEYQCDELYMGQREALALFLPLEKTNWITCGNALRLDWLSICPPTGETSVKLHGDDLFNTPLDQSEIDFENEGGETYICGNPPFVGSSKQAKEQKDDLKLLFSEHTKKWRSLDYVCGWLFKSSRYMGHSLASASLVSTKSICEGEHVPIIWPLIYAQNCDISFAYASFNWSNLASNQAGVTVVVIGLSPQNYQGAILFEENSTKEISRKLVAGINAYLVPGERIIVEKRSKSLCGLSNMERGHMPTDGGNLILSKEESFELTAQHPNASRFVRQYLGGRELTSGDLRYCLWITDEARLDAEQIPPIKSRIDSVRRMRLESKAPTTRPASKFPHKFRQIQGMAQNYMFASAIISSENRDYLPSSVFSSDVIPSNKIFAMYDSPFWNLAIYLSKLHIVWIGTVCARMRKDFSYSNTLGWNTFPVPKLTSKNKADLTVAAENILLAREAHFPATIADLYKPKSDKHLGMPENLRIAHNENDRILEEIYIGRRFKNDTERLEKLFEMYTEMTSKVS